MLCPPNFPPRPAGGWNTAHSFMDKLCHCSQNAGSDMVPYGCTPVLSWVSICNHSYTSTDVILASQTRGIQSLPTLSFTPNDPLVRATLLSL